MAVGAALGGSLVSGLFSSRQQTKAANAATAAQTQASEASIAEQQRQFNEIQKILQPYVQGGTNAFGAQQALLGLSGAEAQQKAINELQTSPQFTSLLQQGENAMLQNASATGGLRGGNTQQALMQYRPQLLNSLLENRFNQLGAISQQGLGAATQTGAFGQTASNNISNAYQQIGAANAGNALARGAANVGLANSVNNAIGQGVSLYLGGAF